VYEERCGEAMSLQEREGVGTDPARVVVEGEHQRLFGKRRPVHESIAEHRQGDDVKPAPGDRIELRGELHRRRIEIHVFARQDIVPDEDRDVRTRDVRGEARERVYGISGRASREARGRDRKGKDHDCRAERATRAREERAHRKRCCGTARGETRTR